MQKKKIATVVMICLSSMMPVVAAQIKNFHVHQMNYKMQTKQSAFWVYLLSKNEKLLQKSAVKKSKMIFIPKFEKS